MNDELMSIIKWKIEELIKSKENIIIAIDGPCGSGKSSLANSLKNMYDCNIFSMDDFFLQPHMRKAERYAQAGGNVDYERFSQEVLLNIKAKVAFEYQVFDCKKMALAHKVFVTPQKLNIVEGAYSMHPNLIKNYDYKIFLYIDEQEQKKRILKRNGPDMLQRFTQQWIPLENRYFNEYAIKEKCDLVFGT